MKNLKAVVLLIQEKIADVKLYVCMHVYMYVASGALFQLPYCKKIQIFSHEHRTRTEKKSAVTLIKSFLVKQSKF